MSNPRNIGYWATTGLLSFAMLGTAFGKLSQAPELVANVDHLGYPTYILTILGVWAALAVVALLAPGFARVKEWAYAGIVFQMTGAFASHIAAGDPVGQSIAPLILTAIAIASWTLRPESRRLPAPAVVPALQPAHA